MIETGNPTYPGAERVELTEKAEDRTDLFNGLLFQQKKIFLICLGFTRNSADAEDLTQEVYLKAYTRIDTLKEARFSNVWLYRITRNTCLDFLKKQRPLPLEENELEGARVETATPESDALFRDQIASLKGIIQDLPRRQREAYVLKEYGDLSYREIADVLKIREGTVMSRLNRARQAVKSRMNEGKGHE